jgi:LmbE family N-acetylglucosaminyl deacetylase
MPLTALKSLARQALRSVARTALSLRADRYLATPETVTLVLAPHQDDETLGCGGLLATKRLVAAPVHVAFLTDGSASHRDHPTLTPTSLVQLRTAEAHAALRQLGVECPAIHFLGAPDSRLDRLNAEESTALSAQLTQLLNRLRPDEIFLPYRHDGSTEHEAAFRLVADCLRASGQTPRLLEFPVWCWWNPLLLLRTLHRIRRISCHRFNGYGFLKTAALTAYATQVAPTPPWPQPLLSREFTRAFTDTEEEFFFEL